MNDFQIMGTDGRDIQVTNFNSGGPGGNCGYVTGNTLYASTHNGNSNGGMILPVQSDSLEEISICFDTTNAAADREYVLFDALNYYKVTKGFSNPTDVDVYLAKFKGDKARFDLFIRSLLYSHHKIWGLIVRGDNDEQFNQGMAYYYFNLDTQQAKETAFPVHLARREDNQNGELYMEMKFETFITFRSALKLNLVKGAKTQYTFLVEGSVNDY